MALFALLFAVAHMPATRRALLQSLPAAAQDRSSGRMMIDGGMMGGGLFGTVFMLLAVLLLLLGIAALIKYLRSK